RRRRRSSACCLVTCFIDPSSVAPKGSDRCTPKKFTHYSRLNNSEDLVGKTAYVESDMEAGFSNHLTRIRLDRAQIEPRYAAFYFHSLWHRGFFKSNCVRWVSQSAFNGQSLQALEVSLPPLDEQRRIVEILNHAKRIHRLRREAIAKARELLPALFIRMFGDPAKNPKGWELMSFEQLGTLDRGRSRHRPRDANELYGGPYPFVQTGDVANSNGYIGGYSQTYSEIGLAQSRLWPSDTLCITIAANIAKTGVLEFDACFPDSVVGFIPGELVTVAYVQAWLSFLQPILEASAPQGAQKNINLKILRALPVPVPPIALQHEFADRVRDIQRLVSRHEQQAAEADRMAAALSARFFDN
ncbi:MAG: restriction endonuclease subunit S, partial [Gammaproteobacteria bacterium]